MRRWVFAAVVQRQQEIKTNKIDTLTHSLSIITGASYQKLCMQKSDCRASEVYFCNVR